MENEKEEKKNYSINIYKNKKTGKWRVELNKKLVIEQDYIHSYPSIYKRYLEIKEIIDKKYPIEKAKMKRKNSHIGKRWKLCYYVGCVRHDFLFNSKSIIDNVYNEILKIQLSDCFQESWLDI